MVLRSGPKLVSQKVKVHAERPDGEVVNWEGRELHIHSEPAGPAKLPSGNFGPPRMKITLAGYDAIAPDADDTTRTEAAAGSEERTPSFTATLLVAMPPAMWAPNPTTGEDQAEHTLTLIRGDEEAVLNKKGDAIYLRSAEEHDARQIKAVLRRNGQIESTWEAREMVVKAEPQLPAVNAADQTLLLRITVEGYDVLVQIPDEFEPWHPTLEYTANDVVRGSDYKAYQSVLSSNVGHNPVGDDGTHWKLTPGIDQPGDDAAIASLSSQTEMGPAEHKTFRTELTIPMPDSLKRLEGMTVRDFKTDANLSRGQHDILNNATRRLTSKLLGEIHGRASFAISCLALVLVGCVLGMMFRSGNFLSAFAVSFIPAMLSIALIVTGQQVCSRVANGTGLGLGFIWGGNAVVLLLALTLLAKLQRQ
jgi:hypothetical protein